MSPGHSVDNDAASNEAKLKEALSTEVFYSGNVQGVGFRYTVSQIAERFAVVGYVENLADGRMHLLAEGAEAELDSFLAAIAEQMAHNIRDVQPNTVNVASQPERFTNFSIRR